jgi:hypothetical protein
LVRLLINIVKLYVGQERNAIDLITACRANA